ncbi:restriction endonuclease [Nocardia sp. CS682]|nr:restriction endonuclease [Nocardia sp. CS682]
MAADRHQAEEQGRAEVAAEHNARVEELRQGVEARDPALIAEVFELFLEASQLPTELPIDADVAYQPEARRLLVVRRLPGIDVVPAEREFRYVRTRDEIVPTPRPAKEVRQMYTDLLAQLVLLTMRDAFAVQPTTLVCEVAVNAQVAGTDKATGRPTDLCLISVSATRDQFSGFILTELSPVDCLRHLNALVSPHPWDLEPIRPIFDPDLSRYKFIDAVDVAAGLDARPVLLDLRPAEFEHLVRELFEAMGMESWVTQASRDDGVDGVAINKDPIMGGVCVIQAKRYSRVVEVDAVRALAGVMDDLRASRGVLVTTSWFGKASKDFAERHGRIQLIEGDELKFLLKQHLDLDVVVGTGRAARRKGPNISP